MKKFAAAAVAAVAVLAFCALSGAAFAGGHGDHGAPPQHQQQDQAKPNQQQQDSQPGVKPSNTTQPDTSCTTGGGSGSSATCTSTTSTNTDASKRYGNGKTAAQIANGKGAPSGTTITGPGNSQPHKICGRDVHAYGKGKGGKCGEEQNTPPPTTTTTQQQQQMVAFCDMTSSTTGVLETKSASEVVSHELNGTPEEARDIVPPFTYNGHTYSQLWDSNGEAIFNAQCNLTSGVQATTTVTTTTPPTTTAPPATTTSTVAATTTSTVAAATTTTVASSTTTTTAAAAAATNTPSGTGGVKGASKTLASPSHPSSGVLGTAKSVGTAATSGTLPFTGLRLWIVELIALGLIGAGVATRLIARRGGASS